MAEVVKMLVLSTGHLQKETAEVLELAHTTEEFGDPEWLTGLVSDKHEHGWQIWCGQSLEPTALEDYPEEIKGAIKLARFLGCDWIRYDSDAEYTTHLPYWVW